LESTLSNWVGDTPDGFCFVLKAHERITHIQRLTPGSEFTQVFFKAIDPLRVKARLGPVLFQLPPNMKADATRLAGFLTEIPRDMRAAFEFRHASWLVDEIFELLERHQAALCLAESDKLKIAHRLTADFTYFRLRKAEYPAEVRAAITAQVSELRAGGRDVYVFFKHEDDPARALSAEEMLRSAG